MALKPEDPYLGFHHGIIVDFINEKMAQHVSGPQFYLKNIALSWEQIEDKLQVILEDNLVPNEAKEACAWGSLALAVRFAQRQSELHQNRVKWLHNCAKIHKLAAQTFASDLQQLTIQREIERKEAAFRLQLAQANLAEVQKEWELLRLKFLSAVKLSRQGSAQIFWPSPCPGPGDPRNLGSQGSSLGPSPSLGPGPSSVFCPGLSPRPCHCPHLDSGPCCCGLLRPSSSFGAGPGLGPNFQYSPSLGPGSVLGSGPILNPNSSRVLGPGQSLSPGSSFSQGLDLIPTLSSSPESRSALPTLLHGMKLSGERITEKPDLVPAYGARKRESEKFDLVTTATSTPVRASGKRQEGHLQEVKMGKVGREMGYNSKNNHSSGGEEELVSLDSSQFSFSGTQKPESRNSRSSLPIQLPASFTYSYSIPLNSFPADSSLSPPTVQVAEAIPQTAFPWRSSDIPPLSYKEAQGKDPPQSQRERKDYNPHHQRRTPTFNRRRNWNCPWCKAVNFSHREVCYLCGRGIWLHRH